MIVTTGLNLHVSHVCILYHWYFWPIFSRMKNMFVKQHVMLQQHSRNILWHLHDSHCLDPIWEALAGVIPVCKHAPQLQYVQSINKAAKSLTSFLLSSVFLFMETSSSSSSLESEDADQLQTMILIFHCLRPFPLLLSIYLSVSSSIHKTSNHTLAENKSYTPL